MRKTHTKSRIIQFHHESDRSKELLFLEKESKYMVLQLEPIEHIKYDFIAEVVLETDYEERKLEKENQEFRVLLKTVLDYSEEGLLIDGKLAKEISDAIKN